MKTLVLGLGNDLLSEDAVGIMATRALARDWSGKADFVESSQTGLPLLDILVGFDRAIIIDAIQTARFPAGTVLEFFTDDLDPVLAPSPHYCGLPELLAVAKALALPFPSQIKILALEVTDTHTIGGTLSEPVRVGLEELRLRVAQQLADWERDAGEA